MMSGHPLLTPPVSQSDPSPGLRGADWVGAVPAKPPPQQQPSLAPLSPMQQSMTSSMHSQLVPALESGVLVYPSGLAEHEAVVADRDLFFDTLNKFHAALGTRLMIPTIGGKELDLHLLYLEVSSRGGLEQVIKDRKWKEVTLAFKFPPTTTSASYVLRKYYISLLHHYEQVYFFGVQGQLIPPPATLSTPIPGHHASDNGYSNTGLEQGEHVLRKRRRKRLAIDPVRSYGVDPGASLGHSVTGIIDGKFDHGYLVTVSLGTEKLKGVLYHMPSGNIAPQFASVPGLATNTGIDLAPEFPKRRRRRRKDEMPKKDPNAPKPNKSGYNFFFQEQRLRLKALHPDKDKEISRMIGEQWNKLTEDEKAVYQERGVKDKERYKKEMAEYQKRIKTQVDCEGSGFATTEIVLLPPGNVKQDESDIEDGKNHDIGEADSGPLNFQIQQEKQCAVGHANALPEQANEFEERTSFGPSSDQETHD